MLSSCPKSALKQSPATRSPQKGNIVWADSVRYCTFYDANEDCEVCPAKGKSQTYQDQSSSATRDEYIPLDSLSGRDEPMMNHENQDSAYRKRSKDKIRWNTVNIGDIKANALFDIARATRNARLLERAAQNYILEDEPPLCGHRFVPLLMQWPIV